MSLVAFIFPGQGAQQPGMGKALAEAFPESREVFDQALQAGKCSFIYILLRASADWPTASQCRVAFPASMSSTESIGSGIRGSHLPPINLPQS